MVVVDAIGRTRQVERVYPDGSYNCPFCGYGVRPTDKGCPNPACPATPGASPERVRAAIAQAEARQAEERRRQQDREWSERYRQEQAVDAARRRDEVLSECRRRGACATCALRPGWQYRPIRFVRHRGACPKARSR